MTTQRLAADLELGNEVNHDGAWCRVIRLWPPMTVGKERVRGVRLREIDGDHDMHDITVPITDWVQVR